MADIFELFKKISTNRDSSKSGPVEFIVAGLGNPGDKYTNTRHNAGFIAVDFAAGQCAAPKIDRVKFSALTCEATISGKRVLLMKPQTFMNNSGEAISAAANFYKIPAQKIIVFCDDISLEPGKMRIRRKGSAGGHNGLKSIIEHLGSEDFPRIRLGVGAKPHPDFDLAEWVLSSFSPDELKKLSDELGTAYRGLEKIISGDIDAAMQICNVRQ